MFRFHPDYFLIDPHLTATGTQNPRCRYTVYLSWKFTCHILPFQVPQAATSVASVSFASFVLPKTQMQVSYSLLSICEIVLGQLVPILQIRQDGDHSKFVFQMKQTLNCFKRPSIRLRLLFFPRRSFINSKHIHKKINQVLIDYTWQPQQNTRHLRSKPHCSK